MNPVPDDKGDRVSPYKGGLFRVQIKVPDNFPTEPPEVTFLTRVRAWGPRRDLSLSHSNGRDTVRPPAPPHPLTPSPQVWHPQIAPDSGKPCVDLLKEQWKPTLGLRDVLLMLRQLLASPKSDEAVNSEAARELSDGLAGFETHVAEQTRKFACG